ncbi:nickel pincer cofactor biosynthesis protein LarB, partial [candidate division WOR-3 bacterium]
RELFSHQKRVILTRADPKLVRSLKRKFPTLHYFPKARLVLIGRRMRRSGGVVGVITGGSSDLPIAEEAAVTCEIMGRGVKRFYDVGVAGIHRLTGIIEEIANCQALVVVAGMEGALPSIIAGIVDVPVIGIPTSLGYGAHLGGIAPLLTMLNSCAPGLAVVNIDNGFGGGYIAALIAR